MVDSPYDSNNDFGYEYLPDVAARYGGGAPSDPKKAFYSGNMAVEDRIPAMGSTNWDSFSIEMMVLTVNNQHDGHFRGAALTWGKIVGLLTHIKDTIAASGNTLQTGWDPMKSDAAVNFFHHVGASTWSIEDWITFGAQNQRALDDQATAIKKARTDLAAVYKNFLRDWNFNIDKANYYTTPAGMKELSNLGAAEAAGGGMPMVSVEEFQKPYIEKANAARKQYTDQAKAVMVTLADAYSSNWGALNEGRMYQGPKDAVSPLAALGDKLRQIMANSGGGGGPNLAAINAQVQQQLQQQQQAAAKALAEQQAAARLAAEQAAAQLAAQQAAAEAALQAQLAAQQLAAQQALATQQLAQQQLAAQQGMAQAQNAGVQLGNPAAFGLAGPGTAALAGFGGPGTGLPGAARGPVGKQPFALNEFAEQGPGSSSNSLLGRSGMGGLPGGGGGRGSLGSPGLQGRRVGGGGEPMGGGQPPPGSRGSGNQDRDGSGRHPGGAVRPESEEYLADAPLAPGAMSARLAGGGQLEGPLGPPPSASLPGRSIPSGGPRGGGPGQGGPTQGNPAQGRRGRRLEELARRSGGADLENELVESTVVNRPDLTGRNGLPAAPSPAEIGAESSMLGSRGKQRAKPGMVERLTRRRQDRRRPASVPGTTGTVSNEAVASEAELWEVEVPETIATPVEQKPEGRPGRSLGSA